MKKITNCPYTESVIKYIQMEYDESIINKIEKDKYLKVVKGYINNCKQLNKPVPFAANGVAKFLKTME